MNECGNVLFSLGTSDNLDRTQSRPSLAGVAPCPCFCPQTRRNWHRIWLPKKNHNRPGLIKLALPLHWCCTTDILSLPLWHGHCPCLCPQTGAARLASYIVAGLLPKYNHSKLGQAKLALPAHQIWQFSPGSSSNSDRV